MYIYDLIIMAISLYAVRRKSFLYILLFILGETAFATVPDTLLLHLYDSPMHHLYQMREKNEGNKSKYLFNADTLFYRYATEGYASVTDELYYYYHDYVSYMTLEEAEKEVERMRTASRRYKSKALANEVDLMKVSVLNYYEDSLLQVCNRIVRNVAVRAGKEGDAVSKIRAMNFDFISNYRTGHYAYAFAFAPRIVEELNKLTDQQYSERREMFFHLGRAYMDFRDYPRALSYLREALVDTTRFFFDRSNIRARLELGLYFRTIHQLDSSDYYFRSVITSRDMIKLRPYYDHLALVELGQNFYLRKFYDKAANYYRYAIDFARKGNYRSLSASIFTGMGEIYQEEKNLTQVKAMIDSAFVYIQKGKLKADHPIYLRLYPLMYKYYAEKNEMPLFQAYLDSTTAVNNRREKQFNTLVLLRAEQEVEAQREELAEHRIHTQRRLLEWIGGSCFLLAVGLLLLGISYRQKQSAYRKLVQRSQEWALVTPFDHRLVSTSHTCADDQLMQRVCKLMEDDFLYRDPELTLEVMASRLETHRNTLSKVINNSQNKNFNQFINTYRLREAIKRLSDANDNATILDIAFSAGFNSQQTFYRLFKTETGLSPALFRKNSRNMEGVSFTQ